MAAGDLVQKGTAVYVGFGGNTNTNLIMQAAAETKGQATKKPILSEQGATITKLFTDPMYRVRLEGVLKADGTEITTVRALKMGDTLSVNSINCCIDEPVEISFSAEEARVVIVVVKEDGMTYS